MLDILANQPLQLAFNLQFVQRVARWEDGRWCCYDWRLGLELSFGCHFLGVFFAELCLQCLQWSFRWKGDKVGCSQRVSW